MNIPKKAKILIVDKSGGGSFLLASVLNSWGHETTSVNSFLKAIDYCKGAYSPDIVIVEMQEAGMLFYEFPRKFHERLGKAIPILVHSNICQKEIIYRSIQSGYYDYLLRPVDPEILHDKITNIISPEIKLNQTTFNFNMNEEAKLSWTIMVDSVNEFGIQVSVPFHLNPGSIIDLESPTFTEHGLPKLAMKVDEIVPQDKSYLAKLSFVGLKNSELIKLRKLAIFKGEVA